MRRKAMPTPFSRYITTPRAPVASTNRSAMEAEAPSEAPLVEEVHQEEVQAVEAIPVPRECAHAY